jgi:hypothetical protein
MSELASTGVQAFSSVEGFWNPERITMLRHLHAEGLSNGQIARAIGAKSRAAISGKLDRLGLKRETTAGQALARVSSSHVTKRVKELKQGRPAPAIARASPSPALESDGVTDLELEIGDHRVSLLLAGPDQCRWPAADDGSATMVCGAYTASGPYCARHHFRSVQSRPVASQGEVATA